MKQFSLEEYLKDPSREIITRDGRKVRRILCTDARSEYPVIALVEDHEGNNDDINSYTKDGVYYSLEQSEEDLFFASEAPEKHEGWINIYKSKALYQVGKLHETEKDAEVMRTKNCIATVKIEWEE